jgi:hypothetical protein
MDELGSSWGRLFKPFQKLSLDFETYLVGMFLRWPSSFYRRGVLSNGWFYLNLTSKGLDRHKQIWTLDLSAGIQGSLDEDLGWYFDALDPPFYTDQVFRHN